MDAATGNIACPSAGCAAVGTCACRDGARCAMSPLSPANLRALAHACHVGDARLLSRLVRELGPPERIRRHAWYPFGESRRYNRIDKRWGGVQHPDMPLPSAFATATPADAVCTDGSSATPSLPADSTLKCLPSPEGRGRALSESRKGRRLLSLLHYAALGSSRYAVLCVLIGECGYDPLLLDEAGATAQIPRWMGLRNAAIDEMFISTRDPGQWQVNIDAGENGGGGGGGGDDHADGPSCIEAASGAIVISPHSNPHRRATLGEDRDGGADGGGGANVGGAKNVLVEVVCRSVFASFMSAANSVAFHRIFGFVLDRAAASDDDVFAPSYRRALSELLNGERRIVVTHATGRTALTVLDLAARRVKPSIVKRLLEEGAMVSTEGFIEGADGGCYTEHRSATVGRHPRFGRAGSVPTPLFAMMPKESASAPKVIRLLCDNGVDVGMRLAVRSVMPTSEEGEGRDAPRSSTVAAAKGGLAGGSPIANCCLTQMRCDGLTAMRVFWVRYFERLATRLVFYRGPWDPQTSVHACIAAEVWGDSEAERVLARTMVSDVARDRILNAN